jgi:hypothetical protein
MKIRIKLLLAALHYFKYSVPMRVLKSFLTSPGSRFGLALILLLLGPQALALTLSPRALQHELFSNTRIGRQLAEHLLGSPIQNSSDLSRLISRLRSNDHATQRIRTELELRIPQLARELEKLPVSAALESHLDSLASRILRFDVTTEGLHFYPFVSELPSASFTRNAQLFLEATPLSRFEAAIPRAPRSIDRSLSRNYSISERLALLEDRVVHELGVLDAESIAHRLALTNEQVTVQQITDEILRIRQEITKSLRDWSQEYRSLHPQLSQQLQKTANELTLSPDALVRYQHKSQELARLVYEPDAYDDLIRGYNGKIQGELGELKVLVRVNDFSARGLKTFELSQLFPRTPHATGATAALARHLEAFPQFAGKELDLILDEGRIWAEVKTFRDIFSRQHRQFRHVVEQIELTQAIRQHLNELPAWRQIYPESIELQIYFVGGITEDAARLIEAKGVQVFGARIQTPPSWQSSL